MQTVAYLSFPHLPLYETVLAQNIGAGVPVWFCVGGERDDLESAEEHFMISTYSTSLSNLHLKTNKWFHNRLRSFTSGHTGKMAASYSRHLYADRYSHDNRQSRGKYRFLGLHSKLLRENLICKKFN